MTLHRPERLQLDRGLSPLEEKPSLSPRLRRRTVTLLLFLAAAAILGIGARLLRGACHA
jgi:hypothetical protein